MRNEPADGALFDLIERLLDHVVVTPAEPGHERQVLRLCELLRGHHFAHARGIRRAGLLAEDVLVRVHRGRQVLWPETWRRRQHDHVHAAIDHFLVRIQPEVRVVDLHPRPELLAARQPFRRAFDDGLLDVGDGRQLVVGVRRQRLGGRSGAPASAADDANLDGVRDRLGGDDSRKTRRNRTGHRPAFLDEVAAFNLVGFTLCCVGHMSCRSALRRGWSPSRNLRILPRCPGIGRSR